MPLVVADRIVGLVGLAVPTHLITTDTAELLRPLVGVVAATVESITNATQHTVQMLSLSGVPFRADVTVGTFALAEDRRAAVLTFRDIEAELLAQATALRAADLLASTSDLVVWTERRRSDRLHQHGWPRARRSGGHRGDDHRGPVPEMGRRTFQP
ncbi:MAG TPA: hypothetical protein VIW46_01875 [Acidimicrobiia bacterium]|jgi:hypothetical protein